MAFSIQFYCFLHNYSRLCLALNPISFPKLSGRTRNRRASSLPPCQGPCLMASVSRGVSRGKLRFALTQVLLEFVLFPRAGVWGASLPLKTSGGKIV